MNGIGRMLGAALLLVAATAGTALAQDAQAPAGNEAAAVVGATADAEANRAYVKSVLGREEVRTVASAAGADLDRALAGVDALEGERLERATRQADLLDRHLGEAQDRVTLSATTIIIVLLLVLIIVLVA